MTDHLARLARKVENDPFFFAAALTQYARSTQIDDTRLAAALGLSPDELTHLKLCRPPRAEAEFFWTDCQRLAARFAIDPDQLAAVARQGFSLLDFQSGAAPAGTLLAARDRPVEEPPP